MTAPRGAYDALLTDLRAMHQGHVNNVHPSTHHDVQRRRSLFSGCSCGWKGQDRVPDDYDATVPMPCPTARKIDAFRTSQKADPGASS